MRRAIRSNPGAPDLGNLEHFLESGGASESGRGLTGSVGEKAVLLVKMKHLARYVYVVRMCI